MYRKRPNIELIKIRKVFYKVEKIIENYKEERIIKVEKIIEKL